jgi:hypothetical protein
MRSYRLSGRRCRRRRDRGGVAAARLDLGRVSLRARQRFSAERMVTDYLRVYRRLLAR